ncbi:MAG TPA: MFS transporter [Polyangiaceae bacterium]|nr:MFS transporter [Polyangiaceae bacterium]
MQSTARAVATDDSPSLGGVVVRSIEVKQALVRSFWDGMFATAMIALTETFGIAAAVSLKAHSMAIALLGSAPLLLGSLGQYFLPAFVDLTQRKKPVLIGVGLQAIFLGGASVAGFLASPYGGWAYVAGIVLAGASANVTTASWVSWMGDLVPLEARPRHFAWRSRLFAFVNLSVALAAGYLAGDYSSQNAPWTFFTVVFALASLFRFLSYQMLKRQYEPPMQPTRAKAGWRAQPSRDFKQFCIAHGLVQGAAAMSGPFFSVWYLRDLKFDYLTLAVTSCSTVAGSIIALPGWGKLADRYGNRAVLWIAGLFVSLMPLPYLALTSHVAVWAINVFGGLAWAGYNLASFNHLLGASENKDRARLFAYASVVTGLLVFSMTLLGGFLSTRLPTLFAWQLQSLFLVSAGVRLGTFLLFFSRLEEYAPPPGQGAQDLFNQIPGYRVGLGLLRNFFRAFRG